MGRRVAHPRARAGSGARPAAADGLGRRRPARPGSFPPPPPPPAVSSGRSCRPVTRVSPRCRARCGVCGGRRPNTVNQTAGVRSMSEGLSATEVGKEIGEHAEHAEHDGGAGGQTACCRSSRRCCCRLVAVLAAFSGYAAAKWSTESSVSARDRLRRCARRPTAPIWKASSSARWTRSPSTPGSRPSRPGTRTPSAWPSGACGQATGPAFYAWLATDPAHNTAALPGPSLCPST